MAAGRWLGAAHSGAGRGVLTTGLYREGHEPGKWPGCSSSWRATNPGLLDFLRRDFAAEVAQGDVEIFIDRRDSRPGQVAQPRETEGRDWNRNWEVSKSLRDLGCAFVPQRPLEPHDGVTSN